MKPQLSLVSRFGGVVLATSGILATSATLATASSPFDHGPMGFDPIPGSAYGATWDPTAPWIIPDGFTQELVSGETSDRCGGAGLNIYGDGLDDLNDMNTVNETGRHRGRYLYRTHEVRLAVPGSDPIYPEGGAVSVVDLKTCEARVIAQDPTWTALDGIRWTPWGTVLFAEEVDGGRLFELIPDADDPMMGTVIERPAVGNMAHEGIEVGLDGSIYVIDESRGQSDGEGGGIYRFVPDNYGDLSSGKLYVLGVNGETVVGEGVGQGTWLGPIDPATAPHAGTLAGGTSYQRPEDLERIGTMLYAAVTEGTRTDGEQNYDGRVLAINLLNLEVSDFVKPGLNAPIETSEMTGLDGPDNLAEGPDHKLWIVEDNVPSDIWVAHGWGATAKSIALFASLTDPKAEGTGIYFGKDPHTLFVNVQHSEAADGDGTWAITKRRP